MEGPQVPQRKWKPPPHRGVCGSTPAARLGRRATSRSLPPRIEVQPLNLERFRERGGLLLRVRTTEINVPTVSQGQLTHSPAGSVFLKAFECQESVFEDLVKRYEEARSEGERLQYCVAKLENAGTPTTFSSETPIRSSSCRAVAPPRDSPADVVVRRGRDSSTTTTTTTATGESSDDSDSDGDLPYGVDSSSRGFATFDDDKPAYARSASAAELARGRIQQRRSTPPFISAARRRNSPRDHRLRKHRFRGEAAPYRSPGTIGSDSDEDSDDDSDVVMTAPTLADLNRVLDRVVPCDDDETPANATPAADDVDRAPTVAELHALLDAQLGLASRVPDGRPKHLSRRRKQSLPTTTTTTTTLKRAFVVKDDDGDDLVNVARPRRAPAPAALARHRAELLRVGCFGGSGSGSAHKYHGGTASDAWCACVYPAAWTAATPP